MALTLKMTRGCTMTLIFHSLNGCAMFEFPAGLPHTFTLHARDYLLILRSALVSCSLVVWLWQRTRASLLLRNYLLPFLVILTNAFYLWLRRFINFHFFLLLFVFGLALFSSQFSPQINIHCVVCVL